MKLHRMLALLCLVLSSSLSAQSSWTVARTNLPGVNFAQNVAFGNGRFVVTLSGPSGTPGVAWSVDGLTWRAATTSMRVQGTVLFTGGIFYHASGDGVWRSSDGDTWQRVHSPTSSLALRRMASNGRGLLIGSAFVFAKSLLYSPDGITFRQTADVPGSDIADASMSYQDIVHAFGRYYISYSVRGPSTGGSLVNRVASTVDGSEWTAVSGPLGSATWLAAGNGRLVGLVFANGTTTVSTTDGATFSSAPVPGGITNGGYMVFAGGRFFFAGSLQASLDGRTWAPLAPVMFPGIPQMNSMAYGNGRYVAAGYGSGQEFIASLSATAPPVVAVAPADRTVAEGARLTLSVTLENPSIGTTFQWRRNGALIAGATAASFELVAVRSADAGTHTVEIRNAVGTTTTEPVQLTVLPVSAAGRIINLSVLTTLDASSSLLSAGYVVGGAGTSGTKALLLRAGGPSLSRFGVGSPNADPKLDLFTGTVRDGENDNWAGASAVNDATLRVGAFPFLSADSRDAAVFAPAMPSGDHTVRVTGNNGATGAVIAEIYDATPTEQITATTPRLINVSVLKSLAGSETITAGFVIGGSTNKTVLVRAIGPALTGLGVAGAMADPRLAVFRQGTAAPLASNDNWGGDAETQAAMTSVGAFALPSAASRDAALVLTLTPGNYTAQASADAAGGLALVEIYDVP